LKKDYDLKALLDKENYSVFVEWNCKAPYYTKKKEWIEATSMTHSNYLQFDHARIDSELVRDGISPNTYWNVWSLLHLFIDTRRRTTG